MIRQENKVYYKSTTIMFSTCHFNLELFTLKHDCKEISRVYLKPINHVFASYNLQIIVILWTRANKTSFIELVNN